MEVTEPQVTAISHTESTKMGFIDSFLSLFSSEPPEAEKFEKINDALLVHMDAQLSSPLQGADPSKGMAPGGQRRHAPGMSGSGDLSTFSVVFMEEAAKAGYTDPLYCEVVAVSTTNYLPKIPQHTTEEETVEHRDKQGAMLIVIIIIMGIVCVCHIITDKELFLLRRYQRIPRNILGEWSTPTAEGITTWSVAGDQDLGADIELRNYNI